MPKLLLIGLAGFAGTLLRYALSTWADDQFGRTFPFGTLLVNLVGCFLAGLLFAVLFERTAASETTRAVCLAGFLGGFTTFSAYSLQTFNLWREGHGSLALFNLAASSFGGLLAVWLGYVLGK